MDNHPQIENSLMATLRNEKLSELFTDFSELALDSFIEEGILKDIPIFGTIFKGYKGIIGIRDALFAKKMYKFLMQIKDIPFVDRQNFIDKIESSSSEKIKVGQTLLLILDKLDDIDKPTIIGNLFNATVKGLLSYDNFIRLSSIVQRIYISDLKELKKPFPNEETKNHFYSIGLMNIDIKEDRRSARYTTSSSDKPLFAIEYKTNNLAFFLQKYGLENPK